MKRLVRFTTHWGLLLHIYLSMVGFVLTLLFAVTGLTLNHQDFGFGEPAVQTKQIDIPQQLTTNGGEALVGPWLKGNLGVSTPLSDYKEDDQQIQATFAAPGHRTVVTIDRAARTAVVESEARGILGKLDDLHKGFDSGPVWFWIIDFSAVLLTLSALTGIVTLAGLRNRRGSGFVLGAVGLASLAVIYFLFVPQ